MGIGGRRMWACDNALRNAQAGVALCAEDLAAIAYGHLMASLELEAKFEDMARSQPGECAGHGLPPLTECECDLIADVLWWLVGYRAASPDEIGIHERHLDAIRKARMLSRSHEPPDEPFSF